MRGYKVTPLFLTKGLSGPSLKGDKAYTANILINQLFTIISIVTFLNVNL